MLQSSKVALKATQGVVERGEFRVFKHAAEPVVVMGRTVADIRVAVVESHHTSVVATEDSVVDVRKVVLRHGLSSHVHPRFDSNRAPSGVEAFV